MKLFQLFPLRADLTRHCLNLDRSFMGVYLLLSNVILTYVQKVACAGTFTFGDYVLFVAYMSETIGRFSDELIDQVTRYRQRSVAQERLSEMMPDAPPSALVTPGSAYQEAISSEFHLRVDWSY